jgi:hypothetical protein
VVQEAGPIFTRTVARDSIPGIGAWTIGKCQDGILAYEEHSMLNTMGFYLWLLPVLFMIHEFEEIFMIEAWSSRYQEKINRIWPTKKPFGLDYAGNHITARIGIGIFCEFLLVIVICLLCAIFQNYYAWYGFLVGLVLHPLLHLSVCIKFKGYVPGIITLAIVFIPGVWVLYQANTILHYGVIEIVLSAVILYVIEGLFTFRVLHKAMPTWSRWLDNYSRAKIGG